ncbi:MAG: amino acid ABC transporter permease [Lachnospiraceae bacterium]|nr:amino acid ABC transporter permease [Lachnospiraceae bacterium]
METMIMLQQLSEGMIVSVEIFLLTLLFSLPLGLIVSFGRMSKNIVVNSLVKIYIAIMRGTPLMLQLIVVYFAPYYVFGIKISQSYRFVATIIAFSINYAAYFAEIYRAGIESMPVGQYEAAKVLGFNKAQTFFKIILPQVIKRILPPVTNETITLVKDTSLAFVIAVTEMFTIAKQISAKEANVMPLMVAGLFYFVFNYVVAFVMERIEKKLSYYR